MTKVGNFLLHNFQSTPVHHTFHIVRCLPLNTLVFLFADMTKVGDFILHNFQSTSVHHIFHIVSCLPLNTLIFLFADMTKVGDFLFEWKRVSDNQTDPLVANVTYNELKDLSKYWPGGVLPVAIPKCGFNGEQCKKKQPEDTKSKDAYVTLMACMIFHIGKCIKIV